MDATKLAWRVDEAGAGLESEAWSLDSVEVDARKPAFYVNKIRSFDSEAWIPGEAKPRIDVAMLPTMW